MQGGIRYGYIRGRRLSLAATELFNGRKIVDIAFDYGFETPSGFANAADEWKYH